MDVHIEIIATAAGILAKETFSIGFINCALQLDLFIPEFTTNVDVGSFGSHAEADNEGAFNKLVGVMTENLAILACAGLGLIAINDEIRWAAVRDLGHEGVLEARGEASTTSSAEARLLNLIDDPVRAVKKNVLGSMPVTLLTMNVTLNLRLLF